MLVKLYFPHENWIEQQSDRVGIKSEVAAFHDNSADTLFEKYSRNDTFNIRHTVTEHRIKTKCKK